ncbi:MAG: HupE/UreJ family protein [Candidatus Accumulibacter sp.]|jgi:urease accessory protein|nr:HupE/UreJ family protein [Accumulibacter sp.]
MNKLVPNVAILALACLPAVALAHIGQGDHGFMDGLAHPFLGMDHLLAMLAVGVWGALYTARAWLAPACFVAFLAVGALLGQHGFVLPQLEPLVAVSVLALGLMLAHPLKPGLAASLALIGGFAVFHGMAHGGELSVGASVLAGIVLGSAALHAAGIGLACFLMKNRPQARRRFGQLLALLGGGLILSSVLG